MVTVNNDRVEMALHDTIGNIDGKCVFDEEFNRTIINFTEVDAEYETNKQTFYEIPGCNPKEAWPCNFCLPDLAVQEELNKLYYNEVLGSVAYLCSIYKDKAYVHYESALVPGSNPYGQVWEFKRNENMFEPVKEIIWHPYAQTDDNEVVGVVGCDHVVYQGEQYIFYGRDVYSKPELCVAKLIDGKWMKFYDGEFSQPGDATGLDSSIMNGYFPHVWYHPVRQQHHMMVQSGEYFEMWRCSEFPLWWYMIWSSRSIGLKGFYPHVAGRYIYFTHERSHVDGWRRAGLSRVSFTF